MINRLKDAAAFNRQANLGLSEAVLTATEGLKNENSVLSPTEPMLAYYQVALKTLA
ncbi:hypothetical protein D3C76_1869210 [compost metagenome]